MTLREGEIVRVLVKAVYERGIEIEHEGVPGYIQPVDIDWDLKIKAPELVRAGDEIDVYVCRVMPERFGASLKRARPELNPWADPSKYAVGTRHEGVVVGVYAWCCVVEVASLVTGVVLTKHYPGAYTVGQIMTVEVEVARLFEKFGVCDRGVLDLKPLAGQTSRKIDARDIVTSTLRVHDIIRVAVVRVRSYKIDILYRGLRGRIEVSETDWNWRTKGHGLGAGEEIDVRVLSVQRDEFSASIKRVRPELNPYPVGTRCRGVIDSVVGGWVSVRIADTARGGFALREIPGDFAVGRELELEVVRADEDTLEVKPVSP